MRAIGLMKHGGPEVLELIEVPEVKAEVDEILVRVVLQCRGCITAKRGFFDLKVLTSCKTFPTTTPILLATKSATKNLRLLCIIL
jgi:hypothetical protein